MGRAADGEDGGRGHVPERWSSILVLKRVGVRLPRRSMTRVNMDYG